MSKTFLAGRAEELEFLCNGTIFIIISCNPEKRSGGLGVILHINSITLRVEAAAAAKGAGRIWYDLCMRLLDTSSASQ